MPKLYFNYSSLEHKREISEVLFSNNLPFTSYESDKTELIYRSSKKTKIVSYETLVELIKTNNLRSLSFLNSFHVDENIAFKTIFHYIHSIKKQSETINSLDSYGRIVSSPVTSPINFPSKNTSMRDGYGWNTNWKIPEDDIINIKDEVFAEDRKELSLSEGETCYITTGSIVPSIFNCIIMVEHTRNNKTDAIKIKREIVSQLKENQYIRLAGSELKENEILIPKNTLINHAHIGLLSQIGKIKVDVYKKIKVALVSTGSELVSMINLTERNSLPDLENNIVDTNTPMIYNKLKSLDGLEVVSRNLIKDDAIKYYSHIKKLMDKKDVDIIISTGGASVGKHDFTKNMVNQLGDVKFTTVNIMPGKPFTFALLNNNKTLYFGLAGNPVSSMISLELFVLPLLKQLCGLSSSHYTIKATMTFDTKMTDPARPEFQRVSVVRSNHKYFIKSTGSQVSANIKGLSLSNGLLKVTKNISKWDEVEVILTDEVKSVEEYIQEPKIKIGIITTSDRASKGIYEDISGKNIKDFLKNEFGNTEIQYIYRVIPDEISEIEELLKTMAKLGCCMIFTTGGSGPALRDVTVLATKNIIHKELPGFGELMRTISLKYVPTAILSGQTAGIYYHDSRGTFILNLPGSPKSINECLSAVFAAIPYCIELMGWSWIPSKSGWKPKK